MTKENTANGGMFVFFLLALHQQNESPIIQIILRWEFIEPALYPTADGATATLLLETQAITALRTGHHNGPGR